jgi:hypothetical protein
MVVQQMQPPQLPGHQLVGYQGNVPIYSMVPQGMVPFQHQPHPNFPPQHSMMQPHQLEHLHATTPPSVGGAWQVPPTTTSIGIGNVTTHAVKAHAQAARREQQQQHQPPQLTNAIQPKQKKESGGRQTLFCNACRRLIMDRLTMYTLFFPHPALTENTTECFINTVRRDYQRERYKSRRMSEEWCDACRGDDLRVRSSLDRFNSLWGTESIRKRVLQDWYKDVKKVDTDLLNATKSLQASFVNPTKEGVEYHLRILEQMLSIRRQFKSIRKAEARLSKNKGSVVFYADGITAVIDVIAAAAATDPMSVTKPQIDALYSAVISPNSYSTSSRTSNHTLPLDALMAAAAAATGLQSPSADMVEYSDDDNVDGGGNAVRIQSSQTPHGAGEASVLSAAAADGLVHTVNSASTNGTAVAAAAQPTEEPVPGIADSMDATAGVAAETTVKRALVGAVEAATPQDAEELLDETVAPMNAAVEVDMDTVVAVVVEGVVPVAESQDTTRVH